jgi:hypothetical protein
MLESGSAEAESGSAPRRAGATQSLNLIRGVCEPDSRLSEPGARKLETLESGSAEAESGSAPVSNLVRPRPNQVP